METASLSRKLILILFYSFLSYLLIRANSPDWERRPLLEVLNQEKNKKIIKSITVSRGASYPFVDTIRQLFTLGQKVEIGNIGFSRGGLSPKKVKVLKAFLAINGLKGWHISINEYNPLLIWRRTWKNPYIKWYARYSYGVLMTFLYAIQLPRLTGEGGDFCNPFARTICLYSNDLTIALHEAGHAKACSSRAYLLLEMLLRDAFIVLPLIHPIFQLIAYGTRLYQEAEASILAKGFLMAYGNEKEIRKWYRKLIPPYVTYIKQMVIPLFHYKIEPLLLNFIAQLDKKKLLKPLLKLLVHYHLPYALYLNLLFLLHYKLKNYFLHQRNYYKWIHINPDQLRLDLQSKTLSNLFKLELGFENTFMKQFQEKYFAKPAFSLLNLLYQLIYNFVISPPITLLALSIGHLLSLNTKLPKEAKNRLSTVAQLSTIL